MRLLASVAIAEYIAAGEVDQSIEERLTHLARPILWHWWEALRAIVPKLATRGDENFARIADQIVDGGLQNQPKLAALGDALGDHPHGVGETPRGDFLGRVIEKLVLYGRNQLGHGIDKHGSSDFYSRMGSLLLDAAAELLERVDVLAGRRLLYFAEPPGSMDAISVMERFELIGDSPVRLEPGTFSLEAGATTRPNQLYLAAPERTQSGLGPRSTLEFLPLDPLLHYDRDQSEVLFFNRGRGGGVSECFSYNSGRFATRKHPERPILPRLGDILGIFRGNADHIRQPAFQPDGFSHSQQTTVGPDGVSPSDSVAASQTDRAAVPRLGVLQVIAGENAGERYALTTGMVVLGRHPDCDIVLDSGAVSRQHAVISFVDGEYYIEDLGSRNGTIVNGETIESRHHLQDGDRLKICDLLFAFFRGPLDDSGRSPGLQTFAENFLVDDDEDASRSAIMSKLDVTDGPSWNRIGVNPEIKLRALIEVTENLLRSQSAENVPAKLLDSLFKIFPQADRGVVVFREPNRGQLLVKAIKQRREDYDDVFRVSRTIINSVLDGKQAILSADAEADSRFEISQSIADFRIRSIICAPWLIATANRLERSRSTRSTRGHAFNPRISTCWRGSPTKPPSLWRMPSSKSRRLHSGQFRSNSRRPARCSGASCPVHRPNSKVITSLIFTSRPRKQAAIFTTIFTSPAGDWRSCWLTCQGWAYRPR